jgi:hypothetical protein
MCERTDEIARLFSTNEEGEKSTKYLLVFIEPWQYFFVDSLFSPLLVFKNNYV